MQYGRVILFLTIGIDVWLVSMFSQKNTTKKDHLKSVTELQYKNTQAVTIRL